MGNKKREVFGVVKEDYLNKMGGIKHKDLHSLTKEVWEFCIYRNNWIFAEYVASKSNPADEGSIISNIGTEWKFVRQSVSKIS